MSSVYFLGVYCYYSKSPKGAYFEQGPHASISGHWAECKRSVPTSASWNLSRNQRALCVYSGGVPPKNRTTNNSATTISSGDIPNRTTPVWVLQMLRSVRIDCNVCDPRNRCVSTTLAEPFQRLRSLCPEASEPSLNLTPRPPEIRPTLHQPARNLRNLA